MAKGVKLTDEYLDDIFSQVSLYQSEKKCSNQKACDYVAEKLGIKTKNVQYAFYKAKGKNRVISTVAKKKTEKKQPVKAIATSVSLSAQLEAEKIIFDYVKSLGFFKRILACIVGIDKLCWNYGSKSLHTTGN